ncbi:hypothetical protein C942_00839 [Photobacterium marinum]|uniref:Uncharacterized protein n=1 Tax=Photobacterium marinum TaxID=1056511 RepID=L8JBY4_9GAMM|nr:MULTISPECIES: hypothetical protein [Photobacterium]ELR65753.1 hypothetical protein C942_00839 [Photobacterium marinum]
MTDEGVELKVCPVCGQEEEYLVDELRETVICICGAIIDEPVFH